MAEMFFYIFYAIAVPLLAVAPFGWPIFYRWAFFPKRDPDFEHRLYVYWFDEKVAYSKLASKKRLKFRDHNGRLYEDLGSNNKFVDLFDQNWRALDAEVQHAYKYHLDKKFEEYFLDESHVVVTSTEER